MCFTKTYSVHPYKGGGTPMSEHELRRALSRGQFTDLLDELAKHDDVKRAFSGTIGFKTDDIQQVRNI